ncbi:DUF4189 domain-containing protein [Falsiroseomonas sp. HC035]|uniref:DUF4189 domain-containing protein n=1 Tax=Falsiroseomonas sp. HC035 TaxID=3390999 RepID=UPI003D31E604
MRPSLLRRAAPALFLGAMLVLPGLAAPAKAQSRSLHPEAGAMCRAECAQTSGARTNAAQACAIRCAATVAYLTQQSGRATAEASGRGRQPGAGPAHATPAALRTSHPQALRPQSVAHRRVQAPIIQAPNIQAPAAPAPRPLPAATRPATGHGVIYGARTPSAAFGLVVGERDRMAAHRVAERTCSSAGPGCRILAEFTAACGAAAHGVKRSQWAMFMTSNPDSYVVTSLSAGSGPTQAVAERDAIAECRSRDPLATCRITASACGRG